jgi:protein-S-isoprenylcysteine O-methyltransferase Ste14
MEYLILIILWCIWCIIHSGMIALTVDNYLKNRLRSYYKYYRLFYNLVALTTLIPLILYYLTLKGPVLFSWQGYLMTIQIILFMVVILLFISGGLKYDILQLLGIRQIKSGKVHATLSESGDINTSGILGVTRHPMYLATIIFVWICYREMYVSTLILNIILTIYTVIGTVLEEKKLIIKLGDNYQDYKDKVSMLFPTKWVLSKFNL